MTTENESAVEQKTESEIEAENDAALLEVVSDAVDEQTIPEDEDDDASANATDENNDADETEETESGAGDDGTDETDGNEEDETDGESENEGDETDDGEDEGTDGGNGDEEDADGEGDDASEGDAAAGEVDPLNDPIPESTNEKTATRIQSLIGTVKEQNSLIDERNEIVEAIVETGSTPEQYTQTLGFLTMYNSNDPAQRKQALAVVRGMERELAVELGEAGDTVLANHKDLQDEVEAGTLDQARAVELATNREQKVLSDQRAAKTKEDDDAADASTKAQKEGRDNLTAFETTAKADPRYAELYPALTATLRATLGTMHPSQWGVKAAEVYAALKANTPAVVEKPTPVPKTPLRANKRGGNSNKETEPKNAEDALSRALDEM